MHSTSNDFPDEMDASEFAENLYAHMMMTELTWPSLFFGTWAAFEPDVSIRVNIYSQLSTIPGKRELSLHSSEENML